MKTATIPSLRVTPELRAAARSVLREGESLSALMEESLRQQIASRRVHKEFIERGLRARAQAKASGDYASKAQVMDSLAAVLAAKRPDG